MKISEISEQLGTRQMPVVAEGSTIQAVMAVMHKFKHSRLVYVTNDQQQLIGTISLGMLVRQILSHKFEPSIHPRKLLESVTHETARDIMLTNPVTASEHEDVELVLKRMIDANVKEIGVIDDDGKLVADLTILDLLAATQDPL